jgi:hypothetical protein
MFGYDDRSGNRDRMQGSSTSSAASGSTTGTTTGSSTTGSTTTGTTDQKDTNLNSSFSGTY